MVYYVELYIAMNRKNGKHLIVGLQRNLVDGLALDGEPFIGIYKRITSTFGNKVAQQ